MVVLAVFLGIVPYLIVAHTSDGGIQPWESVSLVITTIVGLLVIGALFLIIVAKPPENSKRGG